MRRKLLALWVIVLFIVMASLETIPVEGADELYRYITANFMEETGAHNAVAGVYLDYRVFDTLFETLLLLVSVIGIIYFSRHEGDY